MVEHQPYVQANVASEIRNVRRDAAEPGCSNALLRVLE